jgi:hypothetical protein
MAEVIKIRIRKRSDRSIKFPVLQMNPEVAAELGREFSYWLSNSARGDKYCYCTGTGVAGNPIAKMAYKAYERGLVVLYQRREEKSKVFNYWAQRK